MEEACRVDQARLQILESRVVALDEEDPKVYELLVAQVWIPMRCKQMLEDLYNSYI